MKREGGGMASSIHLSALTWNAAPVRLDLDDHPGHHDAAGTLLGDHRAPIDET
jgi:hypothetical protein